MSSHQRTLPWSLADARFALTAATVGLAMLVVGWWQSSGTANVGDAVPGIVFGVLAVVAVAGGAVAWIAAARRTVRLRSRDLMDQTDRRLLDTATASLQIEESRLVAVGGSNRYHRADCLLVRGKQVERMPGAVRLVRRRRPCEMCEP